MKLKGISIEFYGPGATDESGMVGYDVQTLADGPQWFCTKKSQEKQYGALMDKFLKFLKDEGVEIVG